MKTYIIIIFCLSFFFIKGQTTNKQKKLPNNLVEICGKFEIEKIEYVAFLKACEGIVHYDSIYENCPSCSTGYELFIFWKEDNLFYVKKLDNCSEFNTIEIKSFDFINYINEYFNDINTKDVKRYESEDSYRIISHSCYREYWVYNGEKRIYKYFSLFNLETEEDQKNINYEYNHQLNLVILDKKLNAIVENPIIKKQFKRNIETCYH